MYKCYITVNRTLRSPAAYHRVKVTVSIRSPYRSYCQLYYLVSETNKTNFPERMNHPLLLLLQIDSCMHLTPTNVRLFECYFGFSHLVTISKAKHNDMHSKPDHVRLNLRFLQQYINRVIWYVKHYPETERVNCAYSAFKWQVTLQTLNIRQLLVEHQVYCQGSETSV